MTQGGPHYRTRVNGVTVYSGLSWAEAHDQAVTASQGKRKVEVVLTESREHRNGLTSHTTLPITPEVVA